jgi:hypothetical protein
LNNYGNAKENAMQREKMRQEAAMQEAMQQQEKGRYEKAPPPIHSTGGALAGLGGALAATLGLQAQCNDAPSRREIPARIEDLFEHTDRLSGALAHLENRLETVLSPRGDNTTDKCSPPASTVTGEHLGQLSARLGLITDAVESITARLEL